MRWGIEMIRARVITRKIIGVKGVRLLRNIASTIYRVVGIIDPPSRYRPKGVSAVVWSKNEEDWIEVSMRSVADIVDEYVLIDSSTDRTPFIAEEVGKELGIPVKIVRTLSSNMAEIGNLGLKHSTYRWILKWDPDYILHERYIDMIKTLIEKLDDNDWYYAVYWPHVCLDGDLLHYNPANYLHIEHWLFNYSPRLRYELAGWMEVLILPIYYRRLDINKPLSFHLRSVKNPIRLLYRKYWYIARREGLLGKIDLEEFIRAKIKEDYGTDDIEEAARIHLKQIIKRLSRYDENILSYPRILKEYIRKKYGILLP